MSNQQPPYGYPQPYGAPPPPPGPPQGPPQGRSNTTLALVIAAVMLVIGGVGLAALLLLGGDDESEAPAAGDETSQVADEETDEPTDEETEEPTDSPTTTEPTESATTTTPPEPTETTPPPEPTQPPAGDLNLDPGDDYASPRNIVAGYLTALFTGDCGNVHALATADNKEFAKQCEKDPDQYAGATIISIGEAIAIGQGFNVEAKVLFANGIRLKMVFSTIDLEGNYLVSALLSAE